MTFHFPDDVATNMLTNDEVDPLVGTAEFKATAVRIETDGISSPVGRQTPVGTCLPVGIFSRVPDSNGLTHRRRRGDRGRTAGRRSVTRARRSADGKAARATSRVTDGPRPADGRSPAIAICCCRSFTPCRTASAGSATAPSITSARACPCRLRKPGASSPSITCSRPSRSPSRVVHVCDDIACRLKGADERSVETRSRGRCGQAFAMSWPMRSGLGCARDERGQGLPSASSSHPLRRTWNRCRTPLDPGTPGTAGTFGALGAGRLLRTDRPRRSIEPRCVSKDRRLLGAREGARDGRRSGDRRSDGLEIDGPRRRGVSDRAQVGGGRARRRRRRITSSATPTSPSRARSRIASLMEHDPFAVVEAMTICGIATGAERGFIYIRGEYPEAERAIGHAIAQALAAGLLGPNVARSGFAFDIEIRRGGGAYICGEETALFNSIEGKRGEPRSKPPFPAQFGAVRQADGGQQRRDARQRARHRQRGRRGVGEDRDAGIDRDAAVLPVRSRRETRPLRDRERPHACAKRSISPAASRTAARLQAILLGGAAGTFVGPSALDMPLSFEGARAAEGHARIRRDHGVRRDRRSPRHAGRASPSSSGMSHAASACPAASAPSGRRNCSAAGIKDRGSGTRGACRVGAGDA